MKYIFCILSLIFLSSCAIYRPITATSNPVGKYRGEACARDLFFLIPLSTDQSIRSAAKRGNIHLISTVDTESFFTFAYNQTCTVVWGHKKVQEKVEAPQSPATPTSEPVITEDDIVLD